MMKTIPDHVSRSIPDYTGKTILEFGNKKSKAGPYYLEYMHNGASKYVSVDINGLDGSLPIDLRSEDASIEIKRQSKIEYFDIITNIGTSEHVTIQRPFWKTVHEISTLGTKIIHWVPLAEKREEHALDGSCWHPYPVFFEQLALHNNYKIEHMEIGPPAHLLDKRSRYFADILVCQFVITEPLNEFIWKNEFDKMFWLNPSYNSLDWNYN